MKVSLTLHAAGIATVSQTLSKNLAEAFRDQLIFLSRASNRVRSYGVDLLVRFALRLLPDTSSLLDSLGMVHSSFSGTSTLRTSSSSSPSRFSSLAGPASRYRHSLRVSAMPDLASTTSSGYANKDPRFSRPQRMTEKTQTTRRLMVPRQLTSSIWNSPTNRDEMSESSKASRCRSEEASLLHALELRAAANQPW
jgi:hypothetical protein